MERVSYAEIRGLCLDVMRKEDIEFPADISEQVLDLVVDRAQGSPRQVLVYLGLIAGLTSIKDIEHVLDVESEIDRRTRCDRVCSTSLCKRSIDMEGLSSCSSHALRGRDAESIRIVSLNYIAACILRSKDAEFFRIASERMAFFKEPYRSNEKLAPLMISIGGMLKEESKLITF